MLKSPIARRPEVRPDLGYVPWFESLSFKNGPGSRFWDILVPPPFFPLVLTPRQYLNPPQVCVQSYAAVGSYILLSPEQQPGGGGGGTFAYHVRKKTWAKVDENSLPFVGDAVPLAGGGNYFASRSKARSAAMAVFYLKVLNGSSTSTPAAAARLSVRQFPVAPPSSQDEMIPAGQSLLCTMGGGGSFCSVDLMSTSSRRRSSSRRQDAGMLKTVQVVVTTCQMKKTDELEDSEAAAEVTVEEQISRPIYRFHDRTRFLASPMPLVAVLFM